MQTDTMEPVVLFNNDFNESLNAMYWDYNHWYPDFRNGSFYGRTQQRQALPSVLNGYLHLRLDTYNPTNGPVPSFFLFGSYDEADFSA